MTEHLCWFITCIIYAHKWRLKCRCSDMRGSVSQDQDLTAQEAELVAAGAVKVYREKVSGAKANRAELMKVVNKLEPGDVLLVTRLDRLARSDTRLAQLARQHQRTRCELPLAARHLG